MTNALITVLEPPKLPLEFDVTDSAKQALIANGWKKPDNQEGNP